MSISMANLPNNSCPILVVGSSGLRLPCGFPAPPQCWQCIWCLRKRWP
jgi:hypothetical protein